MALNYDTSNIRLVLDSIKTKIFENKQKDYVYTLFATYN